ncbi:LCP family protein [Alkalihalobacterium alkalinitrilicum]|uniref:LCP family protein n=1 Tax=Alkalihalobacterium alkalinitrilicum TaxID=427920 RepID=UPI000995DDE8|nr:LCP family protein [Alkalihalobacterium alkalinitrilicum]
MSSRDYRKRNKQYKWRKRITILISLTFLLLIAFGAYGKIGYENARKNSLETLEESASLVIKDQEAIPFHAEVQEKNGPVHILLIGVDKAEGDRSRTDTIMIAQYHPNQGTAKVASIMRDSYVAIPDHQPNKINASFFLGGPELLRRTIKENFDIDLHYYAMVNFDGFERIVDTIAPNGIEINVEHRMYKPSIKLHFEPGKQIVNGKDTLRYVRFRDDHENDFGRVRRQQEVLSTLKDEMLTIRGVTKVPQLIGSIEPYIDTNMNTRKVLSLGKDFFLNPVEDIDTITIPIEHSFTDKRYPHAGLVLDIDIEKNKEALHQFLQYD